MDWNTIVDIHLISLERLKYNKIQVELLVLSQLFSSTIFLADISTTAKISLRFHATHISQKYGAESYLIYFYADNKFYITINTFVLTIFNKKWIVRVCVYKIKLLIQKIINTTEIKFREYVNDGNSM